MSAENIDDEIVELKKLAHQALDSGNHARAQALFQQVTEKDPTSWEGVFYSEYCKQMRCIIAHIASACRCVRAAMLEAFLLIKSSDATTDEKLNDLLDMYAHSSSLARMMASSAYSHYCGIDAQIQAKHFSEFAERVDEAILLDLEFGRWVLDAFGYEDTSKLIAANAFTAAYYIGESVNWRMETAMNRKDVFSRYKPLFARCDRTKLDKLENARIAIVKDLYLKIHSYGKVIGAYIIVVLSIALFAWMLNDIDREYGSDLIGFIRFIMLILAAIPVIYHFIVYRSRKNALKSLEASRYAG